MKLARYSEYKDTELNWLESLPDSWNILRTKQVFRLRIEKASDNNKMELLSIYTHIGVRPRKGLEQRGNKASTTDGYWIVKEGDIISNKLLAWMGAIGVSHYEGVTSPAYDILRSIQRCNADYYHYLFRTPKYLQQFKIRSRGIMDMRLRLYFDQFGQIPIPVPPINEQDSIVIFLNWKSAQIKKFIRNKRRLIELLKEQKQNVINQAVTRGLDPNVKLKSSGVEWIRDIPEHWDVRKLKFASKMIVGGATPASGQSELWDGDIVWVTPQDVSKNERLSSSARNLTSAGVASCSSVLVPPGSVVVTSRAPVGNVSLAEVELCTNQGCKAVVPDDRRLLNEYSLIILKVMKPVFQRAANGTTFFEISTWDFENIKVPLPPISEQAALLAQIREATLKIDQAITRAQREIELIQEYRTRLISDVVTGQVDVRGIEAPELAGEALLPLNEGAGKSDYDNSGREPILGEEGIKQSRRRFNATENEPKSTLGV